MLFEHANHALFIIAPDEGTILGVNARACEMLGYTRAELLSMSISAIHSHELSAWMAFARSILQQGSGWTDVLSCRTRTGELLPTEISASLMDIDGRPCIVALMRDLSEQKEAQEALARLASFPEQNPNLIVELDLDGRITYTNLAVQAHCSDLHSLSLQHPLLQDFDGVLEALQSGEHSVITREIECGGRVYDQKICFVAEARLVRIFAHDITERKRMEDALRQAKEAAETASQAKDSALRQLEAERAKSERLLLNILPGPVAERLKQGEHGVADSFADVTVLFADIVDFIPFSAHLDPCELIQVLNEIFSMFDALADQYGLEKIKTNGDSYMVVGGLPIPRPDHAEAIAEMALDMQRRMSRFKTRDGRTLKMRLGIHTGPVVAGIIGARKFSYDLWGDTVNVASRMESHSIDGCIQVTAETYRRLRGKYRFKRRGAIHVKGRGEMVTYLLLGRSVKDRAGSVRGAVRSVAGSRPRSSLLQRSPLKCRADAERPEPGSAEHTGDVVRRA